MYASLVSCSWPTYDSDSYDDIDQLDMYKDDADCGPLMECTAATLGNEVVEQLFVSTQQINLELCMKYAVER